MFPIMLDVRDRQVLVVGGGAVGQRKARGVLEAGARVTLVCLENPLIELSARLDWRTEPYRTEHLNGKSLVFAAATVTVNENVVADARARGIWVNAATAPEAGDFVLPAVARRGLIELAVGTGGGSPALATRIRDLLANFVDDSLVAWVDLVAELRDEILANVVAERRPQLWHELTTREWLDRIRTEGKEVIRQAFREVVNRERGR
ncbi:MAG TPA: bifunctional precorrin-2 dehydrogenase/sirohydrochlorin ferrochelatase [Gemmataceae bacterium]|jgi:precorrin-2 dehydrogenase/sirohydrochlorin ferrochelatase|nr:bifunctional precorrin-2 dehydrogenase/sirohydrochlorin ferrochelatase [Gemmataceae bacterium]